MGDLFSLEEEFSGIRRINSGDTIKNGRLSSSIRADDRIDGTFLYPEAYVMQGFDSAESNR